MARLAYRYADAIGVEADLSIALDALEALAAHQAAGTPGSVEAQSLWAMALISYGRVFGTGARGGYRIPKAKIRAIAPGAEAFHDWLLNMRNKHVAHSVNPFEQTAVGVMLAPPEQPKSIVGIGHLSTRHMGLLTRDTAQAVRFIGEVRDLVRQDLPTIQAAAAESAEAIPIDELYAREPFRLVVPGPEAAGHPRPSRKNPSPMS